MDTMLDINYFDKTIANIPHTNFLCLVTDDKITYVNHIDQLISRLKSACYTILYVISMFSRKTFRMLHFPYLFFHILRPNFFGNAPNCIKIFKM